MYLNIFIIYIPFRIINIEISQQKYTIYVIKFLIKNNDTVFFYSMTKKVKKYI